MDLTKPRLAELNEGHAAIAHNSLFNVIPVNYPPGTAIRWKNTILYEAEKTLRDKDIKVFLAVLKAYSDGRYEALQEKKGEPYGDVPATAVASVRINIREISDAAFNNQRARPGWIKDALEKVSALKLHLLDDQLKSRGSVRIISGVVLSPDRKEIEVGINKRFLIDMMSNLQQYHFPTAMGLTGRDFRLNLAMQGKKYCINKKKNFYGYEKYISNDYLKCALNLHGKNSEAMIAESLNNLSFNYVLDKNKKNWVRQAQKRKD